MDDPRSLHLKILQTRISEIACELTQVRFRHQGRPPRWRPNINVYRCRDRFFVCAELAGIDRSAIELRVEPRRIWLGGQRLTPTPVDNPEPLLQVLALEVDDGGFEREILLPEEIIPEGVTAEQRNGLLWINLPLRLPQ